MEEPAVTVTQLAAQHERIHKKEADIKAKRAKIRAFQGLPPVRYGPHLSLCFDSLLTMLLGAELGYGSH